MCMHCVQEAKAHSVGLGQVTEAVVLYWSVLCADVERCCVALLCLVASVDLLYKLPVESYRAYLSSRTQSTGEPEHPISRHV